MPSFKPGDGIVRLGDSTSHGGKVITAHARNYTVHGLPVACIGDKIACPKHGVNPIVEAWSSMIVDGKKVVTHGCRAACGASVISSMQGVHAIGTSGEDHDSPARAARLYGKTPRERAVLNQDKVFAKSLTVGSTTNAGENEEPSSNFGTASLMAAAATRPGALGMESLLSRIAGTSIFSRAFSVSPWSLLVLAFKPTEMGDGTLYSHRDLRGTSMARTRVRFSLNQNAETGALEVSGIHTRPGEAIEMVPVVHAYRDGENFIAEHNGIRFTWRPDQSELVETPTSAYPADPGIEPQNILVTPLDPDVPETHRTEYPASSSDSQDLIITFPADDVDPLYIVYRVPDAEPLEVGTYGDLSRRSRRDGMDVDHIPSQAALESYIRSLDPNISKRKLDAIKRQAPSVVIPNDVHRQLSETYGGRNSISKRTVDAEDLRRAVDSNFDAIKPGLRNHGYSDRDIENSRSQLHELMQEQGWY